MTTVGAYEAKTHLPALLQRVERGEKILITRRGRPVAMLSLPDVEPRLSVKEAIREMNRLRKGNRLNLPPGMTLRQFAHLGHKY